MPGRSDLRGRPSGHARWEPAGGARAPRRRGEGGRGHNAGVERGRNLRGDGLRAPARGLRGANASDGTRDPRGPRRARRHRGRPRAPGEGVGVRSRRGGPDAGSPGGTGCDREVRPGGPEDDPHRESGLDCGLDQRRARRGHPRIALEDEREVRRAPGKSATIAEGYGGTRAARGPATLPIETARPDRLGHWRPNASGARPGHNGRCPRDEIRSGCSPQAGRRRVVLVDPASSLPEIHPSAEALNKRVRIRGTAGRAMQPHSFDYVRPQTLAKAIQVLSENGDRAKVLAGGQSLIPELKLRLANPRVLVDINGLPGLAFIEERGDRLRVGALSRHRDFEQSKLIRGKYPIFSDVASVLGDPQVRNLGTIGGALAHADPASDWGTALLALEAELIARGPNGARTIPIDRFFKDPFTTALRSSELLTEIRVRSPRERGVQTGDD